MKREELKTPCYIVMESALKKNLEILQGVRQRTGCKILLAQKAFSMYSCYPLLGKYLDGTAASGLYEARLGAEEMGKENHIFSAAYKEEDMEEILSYCGHIVFNSFSQLEKYGERAAKAGKSVGIRVNPECSTQEAHGIYDPCAPGSRLGVLAKEFPDRLPEWVEGIHFHTLCEQNADALAVTLKAVEEQFGSWLYGMKWINFGGGHHITREGYNIELLENCIRYVSDTYGVTVYLEPGEAVALDAGHLLTEVEDMLHGETIAILDSSAACHMPDVLEMPYRPPLRASGQEGEKAFAYTLAGPTCLAGDVIGIYSFDKPLAVGDRLTFEDMAIYTMVKNNTFNGMPLPSIVWEREDGECEQIRSFGYMDFKGRL
ncbi:carboxynorspermidine decarboxylase [Kineothrix sedimenti]|uniref:Carboxynorspermidine decarboxylase n=1 Tax=Kineothrix sedimenti TaxID=3123317 RepID=A0ABZ3EU04_9FIRM